jgi:hypothetical protein
MYHIYLGIDPGKKGAVAYVTVEEGKTGIIDMPLLEDGSPFSEELKNFILSSIKGFDLNKKDFTVKIDTTSWFNEKGYSRFSKSTYLDGIFFYNKSLAFGYFVFQTSNS